jgi:hypothetical protein
VYRGRDAPYGAPPHRSRRGRFAHPAASPPLCSIAGVYAPHRRFADILANAAERPGVNADRYSFFATDLHGLRLAGLSARKFGINWRPREIASALGASSLRDRRRFAPVSHSAKAPSGRTRLVMWGVRTGDEVLTEVICGFLDQ